MSELKIIFAVLLIALLGVTAITWQESRNERIRLASTIAMQQKIIDAAEAHQQTRDAGLKITLAKIAAAKKATQTPEQLLSALQQSLALPEPITLEARSPSTGTKGSGQGTTDLGNAAQLPSEHVERKFDMDRIPNLLNSVRPQSVAPIDPTSESRQSTFDTSEFSSSSISNLKSEALNFFSGESTAKYGVSQNLDSNPNAVVLAVSGGFPSETAAIPTADLKPLFDKIEDCRSCDAQLANTQADLEDERNAAAALVEERDAARESAKGGTLWHRLKQNAKWLLAGVAITTAVSRIL